MIIPPGKEVLVVPMKARKVDQRQEGVSLADRQTESLRGGDTMMDYKLPDIRYIS